MPPTISIVGRSGTGKTTLLEALIPELKKRGYRLGVIKHSAHGFDLDREGKDSSRLFQAGGEVVGLVAPGETAFFRYTPGEMALAEARRWLGMGLDLVLAEGFSQTPVTRIEVHRREMGDLLFSPQELWAVVSDEPLDLPVPRFPWSQVAGLADLIEKTFLRERPPEEVELYVDGRPVPLAPFIQDLISRTLRGMTSALKGVGEAKGMEFRLWRR